MPVLLILVAVVALSGCSLVFSMPVSGVVVFILALLLAVFGCDSGGGGGSSQDEEPTFKIFLSGELIVGEADGIVTITVESAGKATKSASVEYETINVISIGDGNPTPTAGSDYEPVSGKLIFALGETQKTVTINIIDDQIFEKQEKFNLTLNNPINASIENSKKSKGVNIISDDPPPEIAISSVVFPESASTAAFTISLTGLTEVAASVDYATADGTAIADIDYSASSGTLEFAPGVIQQTLEINICLFPLNSDYGIFI